MTCREVADLIEPIAAGDAATPVAIRTHLETCPSCAAALAGARRVEAMLRERPAPSAPHDFTPQVLARVRRERWQVEERFDRWFNAAIAAAVLLLAAGAALLFNVGQVIVAAGAIAAMIGTVSPDAITMTGPTLGTYVAVAGLLLSGVFMWFWAEGA